MEMKTKMREQHLGGSVKNDKWITDTEEVADPEVLPELPGFHVLVRPVSVKSVTKGGIIIAQESLDKARIATNCGYVVKMGPMAYGDKEKFPTGAWCKTGDWVIFARYAGSRLPIEGGEVRLLNDDEVLGTIKDPESVLHYI